MKIKSLLLFVCGVGVGSTAGTLGTKKYFQNKYQKQYEADHKALEEYYNRIDEYSRSDYDEPEEDLEDDGINSPEEDSRPGGRMSKEQRAEIKEKLHKNWAGTTNYAGMYREKNGFTEGKLAEAQHPLDDGEDEDNPICENCKNYDYDNGCCNLTEETVNRDDSCSDFISSLSKDSDYTPEEETFDDHQRNKDKAPRIISAEAYGELPAYIEKKVLYLYTYDEMVVDEDNEDEPLENIEYLIGDALTKYGFVDNEERIIFVMNYALDTCYEIQKIDASWTDTH